MMNCLAQQMVLSVIHSKFNDEVLATTDGVDSDTRDVRNELLIVL